MRRDFEEAFQTVDAILSPVAPSAARKIGEFANDPLHEYLSDIFTLSANLAGICGISVPAGTVTSDTGTELPVGLQILGAHFEEAKLLRIAKAAE
ncbi:MAG: amidase family protein [Luteolibacter sp.]